MNSLRSSDFFYDPTRVGVWIVVGALICTVLLLRSYVKFRRERLLLARLREAIPRDPNQIEDFWTRLRDGSIVPLDSIAFHRADTVRYLEHSWVQVNASTLSDIATVKEESRRLNAVPNFLISTFLIIGLGGTFLALKDILHTSPLKDVAASGQIDAHRLQIAIDQIYEGFGAAFYASITGIAATVILLALRIVWVAPERDKFFSELDQTTQLELIPLSRLRHDESTLYVYASEVSDNLLAATQESEKLAKQLAANHESARDNIKGLETFVSEFRKAAVEMRNIFGAKSQFQNAIDDLVQFTREADKRHEAVSGAVAETLKSTIEHNQSIDRLCESTKQQIEKLAQSHNEVVKAATRAQDDLLAAFSKQNAETATILSRNTEPTLRAIENLSTAVRSMSPPLTCSDIQTAFFNALHDFVRRNPSFSLSKQNSRSREDVTGRDDGASSSASLWQRVKRILRLG